MLLCAKAMERAASEPPKFDAGLGNPFYSERNQREIVLRASRPLGLPEQSPESDVAPLHGGQGAGVGTGKGRGGQTSGKHESVYETPPSKMDVQRGEGVVQKRTQGRMPDECDATMGATAKGASGVADPQGVDLQRALEVELVSHLRTQNTQLMEELDRVKALLTQAGTGSNSSWSEVGGASACAGIPPGMDDGGQRRGGFHTPRSSQKAEMGKRDARFTPNGTRIPDGTPPEADGSEPRHVPQPPPEKPNVPPFPKSFMSDGNMEKFLDSYDKMESVPKVLKVQHAWEPTTEMTPRAARAFWLEQEVASLKGSMARLTEGNGFKNSEYWSKDFTHLLVHRLFWGLSKPLRALALMFSDFKIGLAALAWCMVEVVKLRFMIGLAL